MGATIISGNTFDMDGSFSEDTVWSISASLEVNVDRIDISNNRFDGTIEISGPLAARLTVNLSDPQAAWQMDGTMNVTDSIAGAVWRVPPDGTAAPWVQHALLEGDKHIGYPFPVGANGIALDEASGTVYVAPVDFPRVGPDDYVAEWKWDGIRVQAVREGGVERLYSRTGDEISRAFPDVSSDPRLQAPEGPRARRGEDSGARSDRPKAPLQSPR